MSETVIRQHLHNASRRISSILNVNEPPISAAGNGLEVRGIAGLIRIGTSLELEIVPKFLRPEDPHWREDFFFLANLSSRGSVLSRERLRASDRAKNDLASLVGRFMTDQFEILRRRPLRSYVNKEWKDWSTDGDLDSVEILTPDEDGFLQRSVMLTRENQYNATIRAAVQELLPIVRDSDVRSQLARMRDALSPQRTTYGTPRARLLPSRHSHWQPLYDLSVQVLNGLGIGLTSGGLTSPGFVMSTWSTWEDLIRHSTAICFSSQASYHKPHRLGETVNGRSVLVEPDVTIVLDESRTVLVDAKYKGRFDAATRIGSADLYEALAFMEASKTKQTLLVYPMSGGDGPQEATPGTYRVFERVTIGDRSVTGATISVRNISAHGGLRMFSTGLSSLISAL